MRIPSLNNLLAARMMTESSKSAREGRALVTLDLDFAQIPQYPPANYPGIVVLRLANQSHLNVERAAASMLELLSRERLTGRLWIVEEGRIRIHE
jgi:predicted nuclease of predicted toxin-antitoxin system